MVQNSSYKDASIHWPPLTGSGVPVNLTWRPLAKWLKPTMAIESELMNVNFLKLTLHNVPMITFFKIPPRLGYWFLKRIYIFRDTKRDEKSKSNICSLSLLEEFGFIIYKNSYSPIFFFFFLFFLLALYCCA